MPSNQTTIGALNLEQHKERYDIIIGEEWCIFLLQVPRDFLPCNLFSVCVCVCFLPIHSGHQVRWTYQAGSHRRKVTQDFSSTFLLRRVPSFFSREGFSHSFPSSTVKSNFVYQRFNRSPLVGHFYFYFLFFSEKNPVTCLYFTLRVTFVTAG